MWTIQDLKLAVSSLHKTRIQLDKISDQDYCHEVFLFLNPHTCGTEACTLGWAAIACPEIYRIDEHSHIQVKGHPEISCTADMIPFGFPLSPRLRAYLFFFHVEASNLYYKSGISQIKPKTEMSHYGSPYILRHDGDLKTARKRVKLIEEWMRRRLAILEVEYDQDGNRLKAHQVPMGKQRDKILQRATCE